MSTTKNPIIIKRKLTINSKIKKSTNKSFKITNRNLSHYS